MLDYKYEYSEYYRWTQKVCRYAHTEYGAEVELLAEDNAFIYHYGNKKIEVSGQTPPRDKLYILLHEVGHVSRMMENDSDSTFFMDRSGKKNLRERTMVLMEEVLAWHKAEEIAERLDIPIEKRAWQRLVNRTTQKYVEWTNKLENK